MPGVRIPTSRAGVGGEPKQCTGAEGLLGDGELRRRVSGDFTASRVTSTGTARKC